MSSSEEFMQSLIAANLPKPIECYLLNLLEKNDLRSKTIRGPSLTTAIFIHNRGSGDKLQLLMECGEYVLGHILKTHNQLILERLFTDDFELIKEHWSSALMKLIPYYDWEQYQLLMRMLQSNLSHLQKQQLLICMNYNFLPDKLPIIYESYQSNPDLLKELLQNRILFFTCEGQPVTDNLLLLFYVLPVQPELALFFVKPKYHLLVMEHTSEFIKCTRSIGVIDAYIESLVRESEPDVYIYGEFLFSVQEFQSLSVGMRIRIIDAYIESLARNLDLAERVYRLFLYLDPDLLSISAGLVAVKDQARQFAVLRTLFPLVKQDGARQHNQNYILLAFKNENPEFPTGSIIKLINVGFTVSELLEHSDPWTVHHLLAQSVTISNYIRNLHPDEQLRVHDELIPCQSSQLLARVADFEKQASNVSRLKSFAPAASSSLDGVESGLESGLNGQNAVTCCLS